MAHPSTVPELASIFPLKVMVLLFVKEELLVLEKFKSTVIKVPEKLFITSILGKEPI